MKTDKQIFLTSLPWGFKCRAGGGDGIVKCLSGTGRKYCFLHLSCNFSCTKSTQLKHVTCLCKFQGEMHALCTCLYALCNMCHPHSVKTNLHGKKSRAAAETGADVPSAGVEAAYGSALPMSPAVDKAEHPCVIEEHRTPLELGPTRQHCSHSSGFHAAALQTPLLWHIAAAGFAPFLLSAFFPPLFCNASSVYVSAEPVALLSKG